MQIDNALLEKLEALSCLHIAPSKKEEVMDQLGDILTYIENLQELDTQDISPSFSLLEGGTPLREDMPTQNSEVPKAVLAHAPQARDDFFIVPAIIE